MSNIVSVSEGKIVLYSTPDSNVYADVVFKDETFWATQKVMAELFDTSTDNIGLHLKNIYKEEELIESATTEEISVVQKEGTREAKSVKHGGAWQHR